MRQWDTFVASFVDLFSWQGVFAYLVTLIVVKFAHELGHAVTAKRMGCRVPTMGIAFLVMFPMAYTDVNEVWKLRHRSDRLLVGSAGILTELLIAIWATLLWAFLPEGLLRSGMFILASTTWISTLLINVMPFLRFDGYFLLMDWLDFPNLHRRSFDFGKWYLRQKLFGLHIDPPEPLKSRQRYGILLFAYLTWIYRFIVFGGIALLVYHLFPKPLGPVLAGVEIFWFLALPIAKEIKEWKPYVKNLIDNKTGRRTLFLIIIVLMVGFIPWDQRISSQAVLKPAESFPLISHGGARVAEMLKSDASSVYSGDTLMKLEKVDIFYQRQALQARLESYKKQLAAAGFDPKLREQKKVIHAEKEKVEAQLQGLTLEGAQYEFTAPFDGVVFFSDPDLKVGSWVGKNEKLGEIVSIQGARIETYLREADVERLRVGDRAAFFSESGDPESLEFFVEYIDSDATHILTTTLLASSRGGALPVREHASKMIPEGAIYRVTLKSAPGEMVNSMGVVRGRVVIYGEGRSPLGRYAEAAFSILHRELGF